MKLFFIINIWLYIGKPMTNLSCFVSISNPLNIKAHSILMSICVLLWHWKENELKSKSNPIDHSVCLINQRNSFYIFLFNGELSLTLNFEHTFTFYLVCTHSFRLAQGPNTSSYLAQCKKLDHNSWTARGMTKFKGQLRGKEKLKKWE